MEKERTPKQKPTANKTSLPKAADTGKTIQQQTSIDAAATTTSTVKKSNRAGGKESRSRVGGTAVPGAKSTQPKQTPTSNNPQQQQAENYNRDMRRRMQHLGTGPYSENQPAKTAAEQRRKRIERRKQRLDERRAELRKSTPGLKISLGRRNLYFIIAVAVIIILLIAYAVLKQMHIL